ncbi:hypothetical protein CROQUDRAFT_591860 [Cronartium quercuum f. sp. fusiforme G11]|uniref:Uncharacterized protein n=1 Tax=Cronartium quercuum f. sp. fusiforme G11 TaxID=708437 RepID=A0A9P6TAC8_9BASI|nr:hypothetical protein CROQUDRAFT_591860 [Cronartium quercuum f. sp. fusiforme G11]
MMREKGKAKAHAFYDRAHVRNRSGSTSSASYRRHAFIDEDGIEHDPEHCHFRTAPLKPRYDDDSNSVSDSDSDSDDTITDDGLSHSSSLAYIGGYNHRIPCCAHHRERAGSTASSSLSRPSTDRVYPPPTSHLSFDFYPSFPHQLSPLPPRRPTRPIHALPTPRRPSLPLRSRLSSHHVRHPLSASLPIAGPAPFTSSLYSHPSVTPPLPQLKPTPIVVIPVPGDGLEHMPLTRMWLENGGGLGTLGEVIKKPKPIKGLRRSYESFKLDWNIGLMRTRKKFSKVFKTRRPT